MRARHLVLLWLATAGCGQASSPMPAEHAPEHREHGTQVPEVAAQLQSGAAIALLEAMLVAVRDEDVIAITRCFAPETIQLGHTNALAVTRLRRDLVVQRVLGARHASGLAPTTSIDAMIDRASVHTTNARAHFPVMPPGLRDDDIVVFFRVRPLAERSLLAIAMRGEGLLVLRMTTTGAHIVAL